MILVVKSGSEEKQRRKNDTNDNKRDRPTETESSSSTENIRCDLSINLLSMNTSMKRWVKLTHVSTVLM